MTLNKSYHLKIHGHVQGVFFRQSSQEKALSLSLLGWVKNMPDGTVEAHIQGAETQCQTFISWCHQGPSSARVSHVEINATSLSDTFSTFDIFST